MMVRTTPVGLEERGSFESSLVSASMARVEINALLLSSGGMATSLTPVGFEPTQLALVELESTPLDHSGKVSTYICNTDSQYGSTVRSDVVG